MVIDMKRIRRALSLILSAALCLLCVPFYAHAQENSLPSRFDPRESGKVTPVRQSPERFDICWAYATVGAMEQSIFFSGLDNASVDLSESAMAWFSSSSEKNSVQPADRYGTNFIMAPVFAASRLCGIENESDEPTLLNYPYLNPVSYSQEGLAEYELDKVEIVSADTDSVKRKLMEYGGAAACYYNDLDYFSDDSKSYYQNKSSGINHSVTVIGWDDNYSKDNFGTAKPETDGAWLVKSVWGTRHQDGYYWISYCESELQEFYFYKLSKPTSDTVYTHNAGSDKVYASGESSVTAANVFTSVSDEVLKKVSFFVEGTENKGADYNVQVFSGVGEQDPTKGTLCAEVKGSAAYDGYVTAVMPKEVRLSKDERFSVAVTITSKSENNYFVAEDAGSKHEKGESYYFSDKNGWQDSTQLSFGNAYINAYTCQHGNADVSSLNEKIKEYGSSQGMQHAVDTAKGILSLPEPTFRQISKAEKLIEAISNETQNYIVISSAEQWNEFAQSVNDGREYTDKIIVLESDLDFKDKEFKTAGNPQERPFNGCFIGNGHVIKNISSDGKGVFGKLDRFSTVRELVLQNCIFTGDKAGGITAYCGGGTITACGVFGELTGSGCGAVVGTLENGTVSDCYWNIKGIDNAVGTYSTHEKYCVINCFSSENNAKLAEMLNTNGGKNHSVERFSAAGDIVKPVLLAESQTEKTENKAKGSAWGVVIIPVTAALLVMTGALIALRPALRKQREEQHFLKADDKNNKR